jgi:hypothetical protein
MLDKNGAVYVVPLLLCVYLDVKINILCHCTVGVRSHHTPPSMKTRHFGFLVVIVLIGHICCIKSFVLLPWLAQEVTLFKNGCLLKI